MFFENYDESRWIFRWDLPVILSSLDQKAFDAAGDVLGKGKGNNWDKEGKEGAVTLLDKILVIIVVLLVIIVSSEVFILSDSSEWSILTNWVGLLLIVFYAIT